MSTKYLTLAFSRYCPGMVQPGRLFIVVLALLIPVSSSFALCSSTLPRGTPYAAPSLDFRPDNQTSGTNGHPISCMGTVSLYRDANDPFERVGGQTPFLLQDSWYGNGGVSWQLPQIVQYQGKNYYHMIIGEDTDAFQQESYIEMGFTMDHRGDYNSFSPVRSGMTWNWAVHIVAADAWGSASGGDAPIALSSTNPRVVTDGGNAFYPLQAPEGKDDGNGSANPNKVMIRQRMDSGALKTEFLKDAFSQKPLITQSISNAEIVQNMIIDMRGSNYSQNAIEAEVDIIQRLRFASNDPMKAYLSSVSSFDLRKDGQNVFITAGKYIYTEPTLAELGPNDRGGSGGAYHYVDGGYDIEAVDWSDYLDPNEHNPWGYEEYKP